MRPLMRVLIAALATAASTSGMAGPPGVTKSELKVSDTGLGAFTCGDAGGPALEVKLPITRSVASASPSIDWRLRLKINGADQKSVVGTWRLPRALKPRSPGESDRAWIERYSASQDVGDRRTATAAVQRVDGSVVIFAQTGSIDIIRATNKMAEGDWDLIFVELSGVKRMKGHFSATLQSISEWEHVVPGGQIICQ